MGFIRISITQKENIETGKKRRKLEALFSSSKPQPEINFDRNIQSINSNDKKDSFVNPVDVEINKLQNEAFPGETD